MSIYKPSRPNKYDPTTEIGVKPPAKPGEYRMRDDSGAITYVGKTNNLARRTKEHIRSGKLPVGQEGRNTIEYKVPTAAPLPTPGGSTSSSPSQSTSRR